MIGQIANLAQTAESGETPIAKEIDFFIKFISIIAISSGIFFFIVNFIYGYTIQVNISFMIGIIVANVPEGLTNYSDCVYGFSCSENGFKKSPGQESAIS